MQFVREKLVRPLLALGLVLGLGAGVASAYDTCAPCASTPVVVRSAPVIVEPVRVVEYRPVTVYREYVACDPCQPRKVVYRCRTRWCR